MYTLEKIKKQIVDHVNGIYGEETVKISDLVYPPDRRLGDLSLACFGLAKALGKNPNEAAAELSAGYEKLKDFVSTLSAVGPYLNIKLRQEKLAGDVINEIDTSSQTYGTNSIGDEKRVMVEYSNGNTHKETHIGHLRNISYGDSVYRILAANGYEAIAASYINDFGINTAKTIWALHEFYIQRKSGQSPAEALDSIKMKSDNRGEFLGQVYARACTEMETSKTAKPLVQAIMKRIESRQGEEYELWQITRQWSIDQLTRIYEEMGIKFKAVMFESDFIDEGRKRVEALVKKGVLKKSQGAVIADLEKYGLGVLVVLRSDGTATYPVADIPLAEYKLKHFKLDESIYVVDVRQSLYFKQLFKILELLGHKQKTIHLGYEYVKLPSGMMSSRTGNVFTYEELKEKTIAKARHETKSRHKDWPEEKINDTARKIAFGAMKFEMLKVSATQEIVFDIDKALEFTGFTAAYLQYTYARIESILRKNDANQRINANPANCEYANLREDKEHDLLMRLAKYPEAVRAAGDKFDPSEIAKYLFELAQELNYYYHAVPVLKAEEKTRQTRLALIGAVNQVLFNGLKLLGVEVLQEM